MYKLLYTDNVGFDMSDWEKMQICKVFAGTNCIMAITDTGEVLQKITNPSYAARTKYWTRITEIALSNWATGVAIGLVSDGTCMISKRPIRECDYERRFDIINNEVKSWTDIVQVAVSDAFFGLDRAGNVHYAPLSQYGIDDYRRVEQWKNIKKIVTGNQNSIFAITTDGNVLAEGGNCRRGPFGDVSSLFSGIKDVVDIFTSGSECEEILLLLKDGKIVNLYGDVVYTLAMPLQEMNKVFDGTGNGCILTNVGGNRLVNLCRGEREIMNLHCGKFVSFAVGDIDYGEPFTVAVAEL